MLYSENGTLRKRQDPYIYSSYFTLFYVATIIWHLLLKYGFVFKVRKQPEIAIVSKHNLANLLGKIRT